jgi:hypothetical protein
LHPRGTRLTVELMGQGVAVRTLPEGIGIQCAA